MVLGTLHKLPQEVFPRFIHLVIYEVSLDLFKNKNFHKQYDGDNILFCYFDKHANVCSSYKICGAKHCKIDESCVLGLTCLFIVLCISFLFFSFLVVDDVVWIP